MKSPESYAYKISERYGEYDQLKSISQAFSMALVFNWH